MRAAWIEVNEQALVKNFEYLHGFLENDVKFMAVVKANSYGHGTDRITKILEELKVDYFAVAIVQEGIYLREIGCQTPILILGRTFDEEVVSAIENDLTIMVDSLEQGIYIDKVSKKIDKNAKIHIKIDTGMGRLGFLPNKENSIKIQKIMKLSNIYVEGVFSHLATSEQIVDKNYAHYQFDLFKNYIESLKKEGIMFPMKHICNSAGILQFPEMHLDMVRSGTSLFGIYPGDELKKQKIYNLEPVMSIKAKLASIKKVPAETKVSYSGLFETTKESTLGIVPLGCADGIFRELGNNGEVLLHGIRCPIIGDICMDQFVIDISNISNPTIGDEIVILGKQGDEELLAEDIASLANTIAIELLTGLGARMPIIYTND